MPANATSISEKDLPRLILSEGGEQEELICLASEIRKRTVSPKVYYRGLIEFSNLCSNDCYYCGIRSSAGIERFTMTRGEIISAAKVAVDAGCLSLVLQSGERRDGEFIAYIEGTLRALAAEFSGISVTLSCGEQEPDTYMKFYAAGARRYLLRIETSDEKLYRALHPACMSHARRAEALGYIRRSGLQVGTGVMIGLPGQDPESLAADLVFMRDQDVDMVGMGPYIPNPDGPPSPYTPARRISMTLNMTALLRILMPDINIAAATALQALDPLGREKALSAGANVIMPLITPEKYRKRYRLYEGKPCLEEGASDCMSCIGGRIISAGLEPAPGETGDSLRYIRRGGNAGNS